MLLFSEQFVHDIAKLREKLVLSGIEDAIPAARIALDAQKRWTEIIWDFKVMLHSGCVFDGLDCHRQQRFQHTRKVKLRYLDPAGQVIFLVDSHGGYCDIAEPPHLHTGPPNEMRLVHGDWKLKGLSLVNFFASDMWNLVSHCEQTGERPWRTK